MLDVTIKQVQDFLKFPSLTEEEIQFAIDRTKKVIEESYRDYEDDLDAHLYYIGFTLEKAGKLGEVGTVSHSGIGITYNPLPSYTMSHFLDAFYGVTGGFYTGSVVS